MFGRKKTKPVLVKQYKAVLQGNARKKFEEDAAKLYEQGYEILQVDWQHHLVRGVHVATVTYTLHQSS